MIFVEYFLQQRTCVCFFSIGFDQLVLRPDFVEANFFAWDIFKPVTGCCGEVLRRAPQPPGLQFLETAKRM